MKITNINDVVVENVIINKDTTHTVLGSELFENNLSNIFICSKKKSGKTCLIYNILDKCADKRTNVIFFGSTIHIDSTYKEIFKMLEKKKINYNTFNHFKEGKINHLDVIMMGLENPDIEISDNDDDPYKAIPCCKFDDNNKKKKRKSKPKKKSPANIFVFDDLSSDLRDKTIEKLIKKNRHTKSMVIISSQYLQDIMPSSQKNLDYMIMFRSFSDDKLEIIHKNLDLSIKLPDLIGLYHFATAEPYNFLYIDVRNEQYRKNFNKLIELET